MIDASIGGRISTAPAREKNGDHEVLTGGQRLDDYGRVPPERAALS